MIYFRDGAENICWKKKKKVSKDSHAFGLSSWLVFVPFTKEREHQIEHIHGTKPKAPLGYRELDMHALSEISNKDKGLDR